MGVEQNYLMHSLDSRFHFLYPYLFLQILFVKLVDVYHTLDMSDNLIIPIS